MEEESDALVSVRAFGVPVGSLVPGRIRRRWRWVSMAYRLRRPGAEAGRGGA